MRIRNLSMTIGLSAALLLCGSLNAAEPKPMTLTPLDYIELQQLNSRYSFAIDTCTNSGYDYADLYTEDGEFGVSEEWGKPKTMRGYGITHVLVDLVITPTATGAVGRCKLLAVGVGGNPTTVEQQGGYEDVYVKTPKGWRFKTRFHVFPNMANSVQFGKKQQ
jgi:SnoaL-like domain